MEDHRDVPWSLSRVSTVVSSQGGVGGGESQKGVMSMYWTCHNLFCDWLEVWKPMKISS